MITAIKSLFDIIKINLINYKRSFYMALIELDKHYSSSSFGFLWALVKPALFVFVYWFGIAVGIRGGKSTGDTPFILWLIAGILPWFFISDALVQCGISIRSNRHLVTKTVFPISTIPTFVEIYLFLIHLVLTVIAVIIFLVSGFGLSLYFVQIIYYALCLFLLMWVVSLFFSACIVVSRDFEHLIKSCTQVLFWTSPILWSIKSMKHLHFIYIIVRLNPITYVIEGYRDTFLGQRWFFQDVKGTVYFWAFLLVVALFSSFLFKRLEREFADIL